MFLFIRNARVTIIAALAIPTSIIGTFTVMKALGFTLNNMTMLALSLATGIVIDDAIVVLENIFRYIEEKGVSPKEAAIKATGEIGLAVMATTLSLVVIFLPVAFMTGQVGPVLLQLRHHVGHGDPDLDVRVVHADAGAVRLVAAAVGRASRATPRRPSSAGVYAWMDRKYGRMLEWSLAHRGAMLAVAGAVVVSAAFLYPYVGKELVPDDDQSEFSVNVRLPRGTSYQRTLEYVGADRGRDPAGARHGRRGGADQHRAAAAPTTGSSSRRSRSASSRSRR